MKLRPGCILFLKKKKKEKRRAARCVWASSQSVYQGSNEDVQTTTKFPSPGVSGGGKRGRAYRWPPACSPLEALLSAGLGPRLQTPSLVPTPLPGAHTQHRPPGAFISHLSLLLCLGCSDPAPQILGLHLRFHWLVISQNCNMQLPNVFHN